MMINPSDIQDMTPETIKRKFDYQYDKRNVFRKRTNPQKQDEYLIVIKRTYDFDTEEPDFRNWFNPESHRRGYKLRNTETLEIETFTEKQLQENLTFIAEDVSEVESRLFESP